MNQPGIERQMAIYSGASPEYPLAVEEWEQRARESLPSNAFDYVAGGAGGEDTMRSNRAAFTRHHIWPRMLRDVARRDLRIDLFGANLPAPFALAPVGVQSIVHADADLPAARVAASLGIPFTLSTVSSRSIEEVAAAMGDAPRWFQLYPGRDREVMSSMIARAEASGYSALLVTADTTIVGWRERDLRARFLPFQQAQGMANFLSDPVFRSRLSAPPEEDLAAAVKHFLSMFANPGFSWPDLDFIRSQTHLPLLVKGILHPADARQALEHGVNGIVVSNHGGRQTDGAVAALDALPVVHAAVGHAIPVLMDSGIRRGADVLKALALGASAVLLGRPYVYGLAVAGEEGVRQVVLNLLADIDLEMGLCGHCSIREIDWRVLSPDDE